MFLERATVGASVLAGTAGCLGNTEQSDVAGGGLGASFTDPRPTVSPRFYAGYDVTVSETAEWLTVPSIVPQIAQRLFEQVKSMDGTGLDDIDRLSGTVYRQQGISGGDLIIPVPAGQGLHVTGTFPKAPLVSWLDGTDLDRLSSEGSAVRFGLKTNKSYEAFAVDDGLLVYGSRDQVDTTPEAMLDTEFEAFEGNAASTREFAPDLFDVGAALDEGTVRMIAGFAQHPLAADTGVEAFDAVVSGLVAGGISADLGEDVSVQRTLRYLEDQAVSSGELTAAFDAAASGEGGVSEPDASWSVTGDGQQRSARTTLSAEAVSASPAFLVRALPVPGYDRLYSPVDPTKLGRSSPPPVGMRASVDDGRLTLEFLGGKPTSDLVIRYVHDGESRRETWEQPFEEGDSFTSEETVDRDSEVWVISEPDTVEASVVLRIQA
jgi:hypothetical protein